MVDRRDYNWQPFYDFAVKVVNYASCCHRFKDRVDHRESKIRLKIQSIKYSLVKVKNEPDSFKYRLLSCHQDMGINVLNDDMIVKKPDSGVKYATYIRKLYGWVGKLNRIENHSKY